MSTTTSTWPGWLQVLLIGLPGLAGTIVLFCTPKSEEWQRRFVIGGVLLGLYLLAVCLLFYR
jgi:hypothetical protein